MAEVKTIPLRNEVPEELTWRLSDIFESVEVWNKSYDELDTLLEKAPTYQGTLKNGANAMLEVLRYRDDVYTKIGVLYTFAHMRSDQDTTNSEFQAIESRSSSQIAKVSTALSFLVPEILALPESQITQYLEENEELRLYKQELKEINEQRAHVLSTEQESLLAQMSEVNSASANTFGMLNNADLEFPIVKDENGNDVQLTHGNYVHFLESADRSVREAGFKAMYATFGKFKNTFASTLAGNVKGHTVSARIRKYDSARHAAMAANSIPEKVYDQLIDTVHKNIGLMHRYLELRKKVLGVDELHMWDVYTPLVSEAKMDMPYEKATEHMLNSFEAMGDEYVGIVKQALQDRWVDVVENKGKRSGAYSSGAYGTNPYILMNWQDNLDNLYTLVHEFGHSVHSYYSRNNQPAVYGDYSIFVAEVASTCNEELLTDYLLKTVEDEKLRIYILNHWLDSFRGTIIRQTMFAEFEHIIHEMDRNGEPLTADALSAKYHELNKFYFGDHMVSDDEIALEWARIPHFYYNYYVYQYATGKSAAIALSSQILSEGAPAVERYTNNFLKAGCSDSPINVLRAAGVDMESAEPIQLAFDLFEKNLVELEKLLSK